MLKIKKLSSDSCLDCFFCLIIFKAFYWISSCPNPPRGAFLGACSFGIVLGVPTGRQQHPAGWRGPTLPESRAASDALVPVPIPLPGWWQGLEPRRSPALQQGLQKPSVQGRFSLHGRCTSIFPGVCTLCLHIPTI